MEETETGVCMGTLRGPRLKIRGSVQWCLVPWLARCLQLWEKHSWPLPQKTVFQQLKSNVLICLCSVMSSSAFEILMISVSVSSWKDRRPHSKGLRNLNWQYWQTSKTEVVNITNMARIDR